MVTARIRAVSEGLKTFQLRLSMIALIVMMGITVVDVTLRFVFESPVRGAYDIVEASLVVFVFHGLSACFLARKHIVIDLIDGLVSERVAIVLIRVSDVLSVAVLALIIYAMMVPAVQAYEYGDTKLELGLPLWILWTLAIAGLLGTTVCAIGSLFEPVKPRASSHPHHGAQL